MKINSREWRGSPSATNRRLAAATSKARTDSAEAFESYLQPFNGHTYTEAGTVDGRSMYHHAIDLILSCAAYTDFAIIQLAGVFGFAIADTQPRQSRQPQGSDAGPTLPRRTAPFAPL